ncbi:MAG: hypothetical protein IPJ81_06645 [Chitinophagaceae bacterium]|jgi:hypothetical protein|nr:hypothetical protein [Chitinophagaceae bacterium]
MICEKFNQLTPFEKVIYIGKLVHAVENDDILFDAGNEIIELANNKGIFKGITIFPTK